MVEPKAAGKRAMPSGFREGSPHRRRALFVSSARQRQHDRVSQELSSARPPPEPGASMLMTALTSVALEPSTRAEHRPERRRLWAWEGGHAWLGLFRASDFEPSAPGSLYGEFSDP